MSNLEKKYTSDNSHRRNLGLDYMKAFLIFNMIFAHIIQLLYQEKGSLLSKLLFYYSDFVNITTFSSFLFCFGYVFYLAYLKNFKEKRKKILNNGTNTLLVYYLSAFGIWILIGNPLYPQQVFRIITLNTIVPYSEFLLAFAFISFLLFFFGKYILKIIDNFKILIVTILILWSLSFIIPYEFIKPQFGIFIGTTKYSSFPIFQYFPFFLWGSYMAKNKIVYQQPILFTTLILSVIGVVYILLNQKLPQRFPVSFLWLILPAFYTYLLYLICHKIGQFNLGKIIKNAGSNTLLYLLISNLMIYTFMNYDKIEYNIVVILIVFMVIILTIHHFITITRKI